MLHAVRRHRRQSRRGQGGLVPLGQDLVFPRHRRCSKVIPPQATVVDAVFPTGGLQANASSGRGVGGEDGAKGGGGVGRVEAAGGVDRFFRDDAEGRGEAVGEEGLAGGGSAGGESRGEGLGVGEGLCGVEWECSVVLGEVASRRN